MIISRHEAQLANSASEDKIQKRTTDAINQAVRGIPPCFGQHPNDHVEVPLVERLPDRVFARLEEKAKSGGWALSAKVVPGKAPFEEATTTLILHARAPQAPERVMVVVSVSTNLLDWYSNKMLVETFGTTVAGMGNVKQCVHHGLPSLPPEPGLWVTEGAMSSGAVHWNSWRRATPEEAMRVAMGQPVWL
jgi:hypothetical protein